MKKNFNRTYTYNKAFETIKNAIDDTTKICAISAQDALNTLCNYLLGDDWYIVDSVSGAQANLIIIEQILNKYSAEYRKDFQHYLKNR